MGFTCMRCNKVFTASRSLKRHLREVHKEAEPVPLDYLDCETGTASFGAFRTCKYSHRCIEPGCKDQCHFRLTKDLIEHLQRVHSMKFETEVQTMENMDEFEQWKTEMELENNIYYVFNSRYPTAAGEILYYKCNRSNKYYPYPDNGKNVRKRSLKKQGYVKMGIKCTSQIRVIKESQHIRVEWQKVHYGHGMDLEHIRLPEIERQKIATQVLSGLSTKSILDSYRDNIDVHNVKRVDLLTPKDIQNIKARYGLKLKDSKQELIDDYFEIPNGLLQDDMMNTVDEEDQPSTSTASEDKLNKIRMILVNLENTDFCNLDEDAIDKIHMHLSIVNGLIDPQVLDAQASGAKKTEASSFIPDEIGIIVKNEN